MHPTEIIEVMFVWSVLAIIVMISFFLKGRRRNICRTLALVIFAAYCILYVARPIWIDAQIDKKIKLLKPYLEQQYPDEKWEISTVPHREKGYKHLNPYYIYVVFENEEDVTYYYWVENKDHIYQISFSTNNGLDELKHFEKKNE
ncbi:hypothetical protein [Bacillus sp. FJAT-50079]|uniref:hypothetical protein n=1 Tax=Bacillus sp. FJAT-50079 TaxID=2833577 RepID=UPI001BC95DC4|nr:hypothetical protein [Bacillus sp. FJAT-50079]MBS4209931.1 hypothetical protein [Bacillus sp. FJAT-50079]